MELEQSQSTMTAVFPRADASLVSDYAVCRAIMRVASKNYSFASRFLPAAKLPHIEALYALMRLGDDLVDVEYRGTAAFKAIEAFQDQYWRAFETGDSPHPVLRAYLDTAYLYAISPEVMRPYFRAMTEDVTITRFPTFADLLHYMDGSALPVGRAMCHILGVQSGRVTDAYPQADALSIAMQLSNFWRDIGQDWRLGRVYIPLEDLRHFGYSEADIADNQITPQLIELLEFEFARTEIYYQQARAGLALLASGQWGVMSGLEIYRAILASIRRNRYDVFTRRAGASTARKLALVGWARWRSWS